MLKAITFEIDKELTVKFTCSALCGELGLIKEKTNMIDVKLIELCQMGGMKMKIKMINALDEKKFEKIINDFLSENKDNIEVVEFNGNVFCTIMQ